MKKLLLRWMSVLRHERERIGVLASVCLVGVLGFEAGTMTTGSSGAAPIVIEIPATAPESSIEGTVAGVAVTATDVMKKDCAFVGSRNSDLYHLPTCASAKRIKPENVVCFTSPEDAERRGYGPGCLK